MARAGVGPLNHVLNGVHIGATWQIRLNDPCAAAMRPYVRLLWPHVVIIRPHTSGVARNFRQGVRQSAAFLSVHSRSAALTKIFAHPLNFTRRPIHWEITYQKNYVFYTGCAYAPYATCMATPLRIAVHGIRCGQLICVSVGQGCIPCNNSRTYRDATTAAVSRRPKEPLLCG